jgi:hypothetical protein
MNILKPRDLARSKKLAATDGNMSNVEHLEDIVRQMLLASTSEIDRLIHDLKNLRGKLEKDSNRIQTEIVEYASLSQSAGQLTKMVSDSVTQIERGSGAPGNNVAELTVSLASEDANFVAPTSPKA